MDWNGMEKRLSHTGTGQDIIARQVYVRYVRYICVDWSQTWHIPFSCLYPVSHCGPRGSGGSWGSWWPLVPCGSGWSCRSGGSHGLMGPLGLVGPCVWWAVGHAGPVGQHFRNIKHLDSAWFMWSSYSCYRDYEAVHALAQYTGHCIVPSQYTGHCIVYIGHCIVPSQYTGHAAC